MRRGGPRLRGGAERRANRRIPSGIDSIRSVVGLKLKLPGGRTAKCAAAKVKQTGQSAHDEGRSFGASSDGSVVAPCSVQIMLGRNAAVGWGVAAMTIESC